jgi:hypothetical protein
MSKHTRRAVLAGIAAAPALAAPALANETSDVRLRELWPQYLKDLAAELAAHAAMELPRAAYEADQPGRQLERGNRQVFQIPFLGAD